MVRTLIEPGKVREALAEFPEGRVSNGSAFAICYVHVTLQSQKECDMHLIYNIFSKLR